MAGITMFWLPNWNIVNFIENKQRKSGDGICRNCSQVGFSLENLQNHKINCYENEASAKVLPDDNKSFTNSKVKATWLVPLVIYFDTEASLVPIHTCASAPNASARMKLEKHFPRLCLHYCWAWEWQSFVSQNQKRQLCRKLYQRVGKKTQMINITENKAIDFSEVTLQYRKNPSMTAGITINLSKKTKKFWTIVIIVVSS